MCCKCRTPVDHQPSSPVLSDTTNRDSTSGFHVFEFHFKTVGASLVTVLIAVLIIMTIYLLYKHVCRRSLPREISLSPLNQTESTICSMPMQPMQQQTMTLPVNQQQLPAITFTSTPDNRPRPIQVNPSSPTQDRDFTIPLGRIY